jgi:hypothetical protein
VICLEPVIVEGGEGTVVAHLFHVFTLHVTKLEKMTSVTAGGV